MTEIIIAAVIAFVTLVLIIAFSCMTAAGDADKELDRFNNLKERSDKDENRS